jgi:CBS domain containing-hemolysin-like protein
VAGVSLGLWVGLGLPILVLHLVSVTLARALRTYSRSRLEEVCAQRGYPERAEAIAHADEALERSAESLAVVTGLILAALLGVTSDRLVPGLALESAVAIALTVGAFGYVLAGVLGRVFAEVVLATSWPWATSLQVLTSPLTFGARAVETLAYRIFGSGDAVPRPASVEVELPADSDHSEEGEADLPESTHELLQRVVELAHHDVAEIMTPRSAIVMLPASVSARKAAETFRQTGLSRIPVFGENRDDIVGILYAKDLFPAMVMESGPVVPRKLVRAAYCVPETKNAQELLDEFRSQRMQMAVVLDEYGGVAGLITLEDLLEELVGAINDEHDIPPPKDAIVDLGGSSFEVDAALSLDLLNEQLGLDLPTDGDFTTVGGLIFHTLGRLPEPGSTFLIHGVGFTVLEVADHSIRRVRIDLHPAAAVGSPGSADAGAH